LKLFQKAARRDKQFTSNKNAGSIGGIKKIKKARRSDAAGGNSTSGKPSVLLKEIYSTARLRGLAIILR